MTPKLSINYFGMSSKALGTILGMKKGHASHRELYAMASHHMEHHRGVLPHPRDGLTLQEATLYWVLYCEGLAMLPSVRHTSPYFINGALFY